MKERTRLRPWMVGVFALLVLAGVPIAAKTLGVSLVQFTPQASPSVGTAGAPILQSDNATQPNPRWGDGIAIRYIPDCTPTTTGDYCTWNTGTGNWQRSAAPPGSTLHAVYAGGASQTDSTINLDSTRLGVLIRDNSTPLGTTLFSVQNNAGTVPYLDVRSTYVAVSSDLLPSADGVYNAGNTSPLRWLTVNTGQNGIGVAQTASVTLSNNAAATSGVANQKWSPGLQLTGQQWNGAASVAVDWLIQERPITGNTIAGDLVFWNRYNGGSWVNQFFITPNATVTTLNSNTADMALLASAQIFFQPTGSTKATMTASVFQPFTDSGYGLGSVGNRWSSAFLGSDSIGVSQTASVTLANNAVAASGAQKFSPTIQQLANGWGTTGSASQQIESDWQLRPVQAANALAEEVLFLKQGGGSLAEVAKFSTFTGNGAALVFTGPTTVGYVLGPSLELLLANGPALGNFIDIQSGIVVFGSQIGPQNDRSSTNGTSGRRWSYLYVAGTAAVAGDFALSAGWGTTASVAVTRGDDNHVRIVVTSAGTGQAANPTVTYTFHDGTKTNIPHCWSKLQATTDTTINTVTVTDAPTATTDVVTYNGTPVATKTYTIDTPCVGG